MGVGGGGCGSHKFCKPHIHNFQIDLTLIDVKNKRKIQDWGEHLTCGAGQLALNPFRQRRIAMGWGHPKPGGSCLPFACALRRAKLALN